MRMTKGQTREWRKFNRTLLFDLVARPAVRIPEAA
jgi:hypothetical protein